MTWRENRADQNLRLAEVLLDQQGEINELQAKLNRIRGIVANCPADLDDYPHLLARRIQEVLGDE